MTLVINERGGTEMYCCGSMAECRDLNIIRFDGRLAITNELDVYHLRYCPFCGESIHYEGHPTNEEEYQRLYNNTISMLNANQIKRSLFRRIIDWISLKVADI